MITTGTWDLCNLSQLTNKKTEIPHQGALTTQNSASTVPKVISTIGPGQGQNTAPPKGSELRHTRGHIACRACELLKMEQHSTPLGRATTFHDAAAAWIEARQMPSANQGARYLAPRTIWDYQQYSRALDKFFGEMAIGDIHIGHIRHYQAERSAEAGPVRVNHETALLIRVLKRARLWTEQLAEDYEALQTPDFGPPRVMTAEQQDRLMKVATSKPEWEFVYCYLLLSVKTTATGCEMRGLHLADIDLRGKIMYVRREHVKNKHRIRAIPLVDSALWAAQMLLQRAYGLGSTAPHHYLFPFREKRNHFDPERSMTNSGIKKPWKELRDAAGLPWLRPHDLRHQRITELAESGASDETIMSIAGHVSRPMLEHYSRIRLDRKRAALEGCEVGPRPVRKAVQPTAAPATPAVINRRSS